KEQLVKAFVSTEAAHSTATSLSVKRYFRKFPFLLNRLRRPSNHLPISGMAHSTAFKFAVKHLGEASFRIPFGTEPLRRTTCRSASPPPGRESVNP
ncbi:hypothetical protein AAA569_31025, partial [Pseudomonas aeruginosa]|nr:hypothetical protein [Pseudomonas aeruginosa]